MSIQTELTMRNDFGHWIPRGAVFILAIMLAAGLNLQTAVGQPAPAPGVAVVDFYAPTPLPPVGAIIPEEFAADVLASLLAQSGGQRVALLSRASVRQAELAIGWRRPDALRLSRLQELARRLNANRVVIGLIQRLDVEQGGSLGGNGGSNPPTGFATVAVQVFGVKEGRIVSQVQESGYEIGVVRARLAERLLQRILERALPSVLQAVVGGGL
jgi:hypothetical protein